MSEKKRNLNKILRNTVEGSTWNGLMDVLDVSEATLSRYLKELREEKLIHKEFDQNDNIVYLLNPEALIQHDEFREALMENGEMMNQVLEELEERGLFDEGVNGEEILDFYRNNKDIVKIPEIAEKAENSSKPNLEVISGLFNLLFVCFEDNQVEFDINLKAHTTAEEQKRDMSDFKQMLQEVAEHDEKEYGSIMD